MPRTDTHLWQPEMAVIECRHYAAYGWRAWTSSPSHWCYAGIGRGLPKNVPLPPPEYFNAGFASTRRSSTTSHTWSAHNTAPQRLWRSGLTPSSASPVQPNQERSFNVQGKGPAQATTPQQRSSGTCAQATSCGTSRLRSTT